MYNIGTVTTTANSPKITGTGTRWKDNTTLVSVGQIVLIENGSTLIINCIDSIESNTALTLGFPVSAKLTNVKYRILTTMIDSISDGVNKATAQVIASEMFTDIFTELMTGTGTIEFELPNGQKVKLRTENEKDKLLDGKFDKTGGTITGVLNIQGSNDWAGLNITKKDGEFVRLETNAPVSDAFLTLSERDVNNKNKSTVYIPKKSGMVALIGDFGVGGNSLFTSVDACTFMGASTNAIRDDLGLPALGAGFQSVYNNQRRAQLFIDTAGRCYVRFSMMSGSDKTTSWYEAYTTKNTTKDANGNLKAASPIVKLFSDDFELNDESEGVEMEHLGVGHYRIKGVMGFNADGAWGINNGFVIPQDHNGKNMVLIDYEVRPDGDIEVFIFHQQNVDMPERFQNKRIKHFDEEGVPVYFENYEPCDVPESRWIDMRVEMPPNSLYNQKQAEAERLAKIEAERLAQEEAKRAAEEAERAEQEAAERKQYGLGDNDALL